MDSSADNTSFAPESPDLTNYYAPDILSPVQTHHPHYNYTTSAVSTPYAQTTFPPQPQTPFGYAQNLNNAYSHPAQNSYPADMPPRTRAPKREAPEDGAWTPDGPTSYAQPENGGGDYTSGAPDPSVDHGISVKTKFPVARIKRIMQADDDVGKVAQVTPVVVSKALELFMINLITRAATEAKQRNQKRVAAAHLKTAITNDSQFDFLEDIVKKVADAPANAEKAEDDDAPGEPKKRKTTARRKRKESTDSD